MHITYMNVHTAHTTRSSFIWISCIHSFYLDLNHHQASWGNHTHPPRFMFSLGLVTLFGCNKVFLDKFRRNCAKKQLLTVSCPKMPQGSMPDPGNTRFHAVGENL